MRSQYNFPGTGEGIIGYVGSITATGGDVFLKYLGFEAQYTDALYWSADAGTTWSFLFNNKDDVQGDEFSFGPIAAGTDLIFKLYLDNSGTGSWIDPWTRTRATTPAAGSPIRTVSSMRSSLRTRASPETLPLTTIRSGSRTGMLTAARGPTGTTTTSYSR